MQMYELIFYLDLKVQFNPELYSFDHPIIAALKISNNQSFQLNISTLLKDLIEKCSKTSQYCFQETYSYSILIKQIFNQENTDLIVATKSLPQSLNIIKQSQIPQFSKLIIFASLSQYKLENFIYTQQINQLQFKDHSLKIEQFLMSQLEIRNLSHYLRKNEKALTFQYIPSKYIQNSQEFFTNTIQFIKASDFDLISLLLQISQLIELVSIKIMTNSSNQITITDIEMAEIVDIGSKIIIKQSNYFSSILLGIALSLICLTFIQNNRTISKLYDYENLFIKDKRAITYLESPLITCYTTLFSFTRYLQYSQKFALILINNTFNYQNSHLDAFQTREQNTLQEPPQKLKDFIQLRQKYNEVVDQLNQLQHRKDPFLKPPERQEQDLQATFLEKQITDYKLQISDFKAKIDNLTTYNSQLQDDKKQQQSQLETNLQMINVLKDQITQAQERFNTLQESLTVEKTIVKELMQDKLNLQQEIHHQQESSRALKVAFQNINNIIQNIDQK